MTSSPLGRGLEPVLPITAELGECPLWCSRTNRLHWIDIDGRAVHRTDPSTGTDEVRSLDRRPGSIALLDDPDHLLVAAERSLCRLDWVTGALTELADFGTTDTPTRMNDGRCDRQGRFWVGSMDDPTSRGDLAGALYRVEGDLGIDTVDTGIAVSNCLAFSPEGTTMYWADSHEGVVWAFDYDPVDGARSNRRELVRFGGGDLPGSPDGACVDSGGCLWVACVHGSRVARITPDGTVDGHVELPVDDPTMPAFGGPGLDTLFITSIGDSDDELAGTLFAVDVGITGLDETPFAN